jgi:predicted LPLAT superfamily acyltransferase
MMKAFLLKTVFKISIPLGSWPIRFFAWWVSTGYFIFHSSRRRASVELYRVIYPDRGIGYHFYCAWRQFHSFAATYADRLEFDKKNGVVTSVRGAEGIIEAGRRGQGGIILISHVGSFEVAAYAFREQGFKHLIIMGEKEAKQVPRDQREALAARGIHIQVATGQEASLLGGLEAIQFIRGGGFVSLAGDLVWTDPHSRVSVRLFGHDVSLSSGPHLLALVSGAPLFTLFTLRMKRGRHQIFISPPRFVKASSRSERNNALQASAQDYASALEEIVHRHPFQWFIFGPFFRSASAAGWNSRSGLSSSDPSEDRQ